MVAPTTQKPGNFLTEWASWNPERVDAALLSKVTCPNPNCKKTMRAIEGFDVEKIRIKCIHCDKIPIIGGQLAWRSGGRICSDCGIEAPTKRVDFHQNIGFLVARQSSSISGTMCKRCIRSNFFRMTSKTLFFGPLGVTSLIVTPFFLLNNIAQFALSLPMASAPPGAQKPRLDGSAFETVSEHAEEILQMLSLDVPPIQVAQHIAEKSDLTHSQMMMFMQAMIQMHIRTAHAEALALGATSE